jgi:hypothetical protein
MKKQLIPVVIFIFLVIPLLAAKISINKFGNKTLPQNFDKFRYIEYPISCKGKTIEEYEQRYQNQSGYHEPILYTGIYDRKWDKNIKSQQFNTLTANKNDIIAKIEQYPGLDINKKPSLLNYFQPAKIKNYLESYQVRPSEYALYGNGYYFLDDGAILELRADYFFSETKAKNKTACFDNGIRDVYLNLNKDDVKGNYITYSLPYNYTFAIFTPRYCSIYSFLKTSNDIFLVCLSEKESMTKVKYLVFGFSAIDRITDKSPPSKESFLLPTLYEEVEDSLTFYDNSDDDFRSIIDIFQNQKGEYFLLTMSQAFKISPDKSGFLTIQNIILPQEIKEYAISFPWYYDLDKYQAPYLFGFAKNSGGFVFDINKGKFLKVNQSNCNVHASEEFYNDTIDPFISGPYKSLRYHVLSPNHIQVEQTSQNSGCVTNEGTVDVYFTGDDVNCNIKIDGKMQC